ncbi:MAG: tryptophan--tRNA ligase, partial [Candidatus Bathyarchaeota archaeon]
MAGNNENMIVTPWKVSGEIDYERLISKFGTQPLSDEILSHIKKFTGKLHTQLRRKLFFSHRDLNWLLNLYEKGQNFVLYTGRGPSGPVHIGHIIPWIFTKHLQDVFGAKLYFQMTDDEKFLMHSGSTLKKCLSYTYENALDVIAVGFDEKKTKIISDVEHIKTLYKLALEVAKHVTYSTVKAAFGFEDSSNIG